MNYIKKLEAENAELKAELAGLREGLAELQSYALSPKFYDDPTIQKQDVLNRLAEAETLASDAKYAEQDKRENPNPYPPRVYPKF